MGDKHNQIVQALNETTAFPWHGVARCSDGSAVLIFPFLRATWELHDHNRQLSRDRSIKWKDAFVIGHFQDRWFRVLYVVNKITSLEGTITESDRGFDWIDAHQELPLWLDLFHFYFPMLLDAMVVALGLIICDAPESFPRQFKTLFREDMEFSDAKLRCDEEAFRSALSNSRDWYKKIRPMDGKNIRDSIAHRLSKWQVTTQRGVPGDSQIVRAQLQGQDSDISHEDGLKSAEERLSGLCAFLSALPSETWIRTQFEGRDLITAEGIRDVGGRFLPELPEAITIET